jgi:spermidine synthase
LAILEGFALRVSRRRNACHDGVTSMQGLHLTADLYGCGCEGHPAGSALLVDAGQLASLCGMAVARAGLTRVDEKFFTFPPWQGQPGGVTGAVLLAESHLALHTWPERAGVTLDVYVCNFSTDNSAKAERLLEELVAAFTPRQRYAQRLLRGPEPEAVPGQDRQELLLESLNPDSVYGFRAHRRLEKLRSAHQDIEVWETGQFGRLFRLDGAFMTSERDEFFYHEPIVHCAALAHPDPRRALVIGGGDGGSSEELLKHPGIERVVMAELDAEVPRIAREHLGSVHRGAFDDPRLELRIGDGFEFIATTAERFDLVVLDLTDPDTPAARLYTREFFARARAALAPGGAISLHLGSPVYQPERVRRLLTDLAAVFPIVRPLGLFVPLYGAYWGLAVVSDSLDPCTIDTDEIERRLAARGIGDLQLYNAPLHHALFTLPNFYRQLLA